MDGQRDENEEGKKKPNAEDFDSHGVRNNACSIASLSEGDISATEDANGKALREATTRPASLIFSLFFSFLACMHALKIRSDRFHSTLLDSFYLFIAIDL